MRRVGGWAALGGAVVMMTAIATAESEDPVVVFAYVPAAVLDAVVLAIGIHLVVVAFVSVRQGVLIAVVVSLIDRLRRQYRPSGEVLVHDGHVVPRLAGRIPATVSEQELAGLLVHRFGTSLFFENASYFEERMSELRAAAETPAHTLVLDCAAMSDLDYTGAGVLRRLAESLSQGVDDW